MSFCRMTLRELAMVWVALLVPSSVVHAAINVEPLADFTSTSGPRASAPNNFLRVGNIVFFTARGEVGEGDVWRTDGSAAGTFRVKDINPYWGARATFMGTLGDVLYFAADDGEHGRELWRSDGTEAGTLLVKDINPGAGDAFSASWVSGSSLVFNDWLYFRAYNVTHGQELWATDGTPDGTRLIKDINPDGDAFRAMSVVDNRPRPGSLTHTTEVDTRLLPLVASGPVIYFAADDGEHGVELWRSNGSADGTRMVADLSSAASQTGSTPLNLAAFGDALIFTADDGVHGREPWITSAAGITMLVDAMPGTASSVGVDALGRSGSFGVALDGTFIFVADTPYAAWPIGQKPNVWRTDGTITGTRLIGADRLVVSDVYADRFFRVGSDVYFLGALATDSPSQAGSDTALWRTNGTDAGTTEVTGMAVAPELVNFSNLYATNDALYFTAATADQPDRKGLWRASAQPVGVTLLIDDLGAAPLLRFVPGSGNTTYVSSSQPGSLWSTDGTSVGTRRLHASSSVCSNTALLATLGDSAVFAACDVAGNDELWLVRDDKAALLRDLLPGEWQGGLARVVAVSAQYVWVSALDNERSKSLWAVDRSTGLKARLASGPSADYADGALFEAVVIDNVLYFPFDVDGMGQELWRSDGTTAGTYRVKDIVPGEVGSTPVNLIAMNGVLYFTAYVPDAPAARLAGASVRSMAATSDIPTIEFVEPLPAFPVAPVPGVGFVRRELPSPNFVGGTLLVDGLPNTEPGFVRIMPEPTPDGIAVPVELRPGFIAVTGRPNVGLWRSDGTDDGTIQLAAFPGDSGTIYRDRQMTYVSDGARLFFAAPDDAHGSELWVSDGTPAGTQLLADVVPGPTGSDPSHLTLFKGRLYFHANEITSQALWTSDGTVAGTQRVKTFWNAPSTSCELDCPDVMIQNMFAGTDRLYLAFDETLDGGSGIRFKPRKWQLWVSDGTTDGTTLLLQTPFAFDAPIDRIGELRLAGEQLYAFGLAPGSDNYVVYGIDGANGAFTALKSFAPFDRSRVRALDARGSSSVLDDLMFFSAADLDHGYELWASNGVAGRAALLTDLAPGSADARFGWIKTGDIVTDGEDVFFTASTEQSGAKLWRMRASALSSAVAPPPVDSSPAAPVDSAGDGGGGGVVDMLFLVMASLLVIGSGKPSPFQKYPR